MPSHVSQASARPRWQHQATTGDTCQHQPGCECRRPQLGRAIVVVVALQLLMACITIASGSTAVGLIACVAMGGCAWMAAVAEVIAYYRVGLGEIPQPDLRNVRTEGYRPHQHMP